MTPEQNPPPPGFERHVRIGQWPEVRPEAINGGKSLYFTSALIFADNKVCARASAVFKIV